MEISDEVVADRIFVLADWRASFKQLREAGIELDEWLLYHQDRRSKLTDEEKRVE